jgi:WD40 repeat protein
VGLPCGYDGIWSPDSTRYAVSSADARTIYVTDGVTTRAVAMPPERTVWGIVTWTADSSGLVFTARDPASGRYRIYYLDLTVDSEALAVTPADLDFNPNSVWVSPDGGSILLLGPSFDPPLYVVDLRSPQFGFAKRIDANLTGRGGFSWSPDSQRLAFAAGSGIQLSVLDRDRIGLSPPIALGDSSLPVATDFVTWTPDGERLLYPTASGVFAVPAGGGAPDLIVADPLRQRDYAWLSGDPQRFIYSSRAGLSAIDMTAPSPRTPVQLDGNPPSQFSVAPARSAVFYYRYGQNRAPSKLWMVDLRTSTPAAPAELFDFGTGILNYAVSDDSSVGQN